MNSRCSFFGSLFFLLPLIETVFNFWNGALLQIYAHIYTRQGRKYLHKKTSEFLHQSVSAVRQTRGALGAFARRHFTPVIDPLWHWEGSIPRGFSLQPGCFKLSSNDDHKASLRQFDPRGRAIQYERGGCSIIRDMHSQNQPRHCTYINNFVEK